MHSIGHTLLSLALAREVEPATLGLAVDYAGCGLVRCKLWIRVLLGELHEGGHVIDGCARLQVAVLREQGDSSDVTLLS
jgi:hypothetical protein